MAAEEFFGVLRGLFRTSPHGGGALPGPGVSCFGRPHIKSWPFWRAAGLFWGLTIESGNAQRQWAGLPFPRRCSLNGHPPSDLEFAALGQTVKRTNWGQSSPAPANMIWCWCFWGCCRQIFGDPNSNVTKRCRTGAPRALGSGWTAASISTSPTSHGLRAKVSAT